MIIRTTLLATSLLLSLATSVSAQSLTEAWRTPGFVMPESVSYDPGTKALYVGNINSPDMSANGQGYISQVGLDGTVMKEKFATGLNAPKGTFVADGKLYVAGVEEVAVIDLATGEVTARWHAAGATFLNDLALADDGTLYVTETMQGAVYAFEDGVGTQWLADPALAGANGIVVSGDKLLVATLGDLSGGFENLKPSNVKSVDIATKAITDFGSATPIGMLDGIELVDGGALVTDNGGGKLVLVGSDGKLTEIGATGAGSADFEYVPADKLIAVPITPTGEVIGFTYAP
jgi:sugar lactone lactonase YvrE